MDTADLFDVTSVPGPARQLSYFDAWLSSAPGKGGPMSTDSASVYRDMWGTFAAWCVQNSLHCADVTAEQLEAFLMHLPVRELRRPEPGRRPRLRTKGEELDARYTLRLLRLIERVLSERARKEGLEPFTAVQGYLDFHPEVTYAEARTKDKLPEYLQPAAARALVAHLMAPAPSGHAWQQRRNAVAVALHLGAGLTPLEVRELQIADVIDTQAGTRKLRVPANGTVPVHEAPMAPWSWRIVQSWLEVRDRSAIEGDYLLPGTRRGQQWSKTSHYESVTGLLQEVGLADAGGAYALRHTFALRQLARGRTLSEVSRWLGVQEAAIARYRHIIAETQVEVV